MKRHKCKFHKYRKCANRVFWQFDSDAEVLKDRDLSGELKDIWGAVQAKRLREKDSAPSYESYLASQNQIYIDFDPSDVPPYQSDKTYDNYQSTQQSLSQQQQQQSHHQQQQQQQHQQNQQQLIQSQQQYEQQDMINGTSTDEVDNIERHENSLNRNNVTRPSNIDTTIVTATPITPNNKQALESDTVNKNERPITKKEKLSGFLPNGCHNIFPFMKAKNDKTTCKQASHNNKILNNDTANLETEIAKLDIGKMS